MNVLSGFVELVFVDDVVFVFECFVGGVVVIVVVDDIVVCCCLSVSVRVIIVEE